MAADVAEGMVTPQTATDVYGVIIGPSGIDAAATAERRRALSAAGARVALTSAGEVDEGQTRTIALDRDTAASLGVTTNDVVEVANPNGAPTRLWVSTVTSDATGLTAVSRETLTLLGVSASATVELRLVYVAPRDVVR